MPNNITETTNIRKYMTDIQIREKIVNVLKLNQQKDIDKCLSHIKTCVICQQALQIR